MLRRLILLLALLFAPATAHALDTSDPVRMIKDLYAGYAKDKEQSEPENVYSRRLQRLFDAEREKTPEGQSGAIDWDLFVDGNDWDLSSIRLDRVSQTGSRARVRARFKNHNEPREILYDLVKERGEWRIDEMQSTIKPRWVLTKILRGEKDAFPDEGKEDERPR